MRFRSRSRSRMMNFWRASSSGVIHCKYTKEVGSREKKKTQNSRRCSKNVQTIRKFAEIVGFLPLFLGVNFNNDARIEVHGILLGDDNETYKNLILKGNLRNMYELSEKTMQF